MKIGLYIHIPFCVQKCLYCDFPSHASLSALYEPYIAALCREISGLGGILAECIVDTIYIGGGTPTVLSIAGLERIMQQVQTSFMIDKDAEISIEANPGTVDREKLVALRAAGVNRISIGVQTFSDDLLLSIGRIHSANEAIEAVMMAKEAQFSNINIDLMYGLPGQSTQDLQHSIMQAVELNVTHISAYGLKVEEGTPFAVMERQGTLLLPTEEIDEAMYEQTTALLPAQGFRRYEISNFAKVGYECRHNLKYWQYQPYIGVGTAAHSFWQQERLANIDDVERYIVAATRGELPIKERETPDTLTAMAEFVFLALRTVQGVAVRDFQQLFNVDFFQHYDDIIVMLVGKKLIEATATRIYLTSLGMKYGNVVFGAFLPKN